MSARRRVIAVDGPAASGKTTLARRLAEHFGLPFLDTGLLYRAVARRLVEQGAEAEDVEAACAAARSLEAADLGGTGLHSSAVSEGASRVAAIPEVREALLDVQRHFGDDGPGAVLAGRDIGTVVRSDATHKIFVTASLDERARRRAEELRARGQVTIFGEVLKELRRRDARDKSRAVAPLVPADDAFVLDSTGIDAERAFAIARDHIEGRR